MSLPNRALSFLLVVCFHLPVGSSWAAAGPDASDRTAAALLTAMKAQNYAAAFEMFDATMKDAVSEEKLRAVWSAQVGTFGPLVSWTITQRSQAQGKDIRIALLKFDHGALQATVAVEPGTQSVVGFLLKPAPSTKAAPPAPYVDPSKFRSVDVSIGSAPFVLGGTLTVPMSLGRSPGVVLVHGSGPQDRDETVGANKVFQDLAEGLASRGIEVLRYDKRTFVYGAQLGDSISVDDEVIVDAAAALAALRARPEVDPDRLFVIGHSMGAQLAPEIAMRAAPVAGVVLLAPPGRPPWELLLSQLHYLNAPAKEVAEVESKVARLKAGTLGSEKLLGAPQAYWKNLAAHDGIAAAKKLGKPVLVLRGERDYQVIDADMDAWRQDLAGTPSAEIAVMPGDNHLFIPGSGKPGPAEYEKPGHVDARVIDKIAAFLSSKK